MHLSNREGLGRVHKVRSVTLGDEEDERRLDSEDAKKTKMPNTDVRHLL